MKITLQVITVAIAVAATTSVAVSKKAFRHATPNKELEHVKKWPKHLFQHTVIASFSAAEEAEKDAICSSCCGVLDNDGEDTDAFVNLFPQDGTCEKEFGIPSPYNIAQNEYMEYVVGHYFPEKFISKLTISGPDEDGKSASPDELVLKPEGEITKASVALARVTTEVDDNWHKKCCSQCPNLNTEHCASE